MKFFLLSLFTFLQFKQNELPESIEIRSKSSKVMCYYYNQKYENFYHTIESHNFRIDRITDAKSIKIFQKKIYACIDVKNEINDINYIDLRKVILFKYGQKIDTIGYNPKFKYLHYKNRFYKCRSVHWLLRGMEPKD